MDGKVLKSPEGIYTHITHGDFKPVLSNGAETVFQMFMKNAADRPDAPFLGTIADEKVTYRNYAEIKQDVLRLAGALQKLLEDSKTSIVGIYSINRPEWVITEYATYAINTVNCPLFSNFSPEALSDILLQTEMETLVVSADKLRYMFKVGIFKEDSHLHKVRQVIIMDDDPGLAADCGRIGIKALLLSSILGGEQSSLSPREPGPDDLATICYTSGTSGSPKGVLLTHKNIISNVAAFYNNRDPAMYPQLDDTHVYISYLPLPHVLERICFFASTAAFARIAFYRGNPKLIQADLKIIRPTFIVTVPRVLNAFMEKIQEKISQKNFLLRGLFKLALKYKKWRLKSGSCKCWLLDKLIFDKVANEFGGSIQASLCGGAPLKPDVLEYIQAVMCIRVFQGYGQTEGFAANIVMPFDNMDLESVGIPFPSVEVRLRHVDDYDAPEGGAVGEVLLRGDPITQGYFRKEDKTRELFEDGWLKTGDVAVERGGMFYIVGRVKDIFKTSFGEYIVPETIEISLADNDIISDLFVTNSKYSDYCVGVAVCTKPGVSDEEVLARLDANAKACLETNRLKRYEIPDRYIVTRQPFHELECDEALVTPSMKKRRAHMVRYFRAQIAEAYGREDE